MNKLATLALGLTGLGLTLLTGCAAQRDAEKEELARIDARHQHALLAFKDAQDTLRNHTYLPQRREYGDEGTLLVRQAYLGGRLGSELLRVRFTYVNSTDRDVHTARVKLTLRDPHTRTQWYETVDLVPPYSFSLTPGSTYSSWFAMPTMGVHRSPSWSWDIELDTLGAGEL